MSISGDWDRRISRRTLLRTGGSLAAGLAVTGTLGRTAAARAPFSGDPFSLGVASGDPLPDGVVLWTRLAPDPTRADGGLPAEPYGVRYEVALDDAFSRIIDRGAVEATPDEAHSVHVELTRLRPSTELFYRFKVGTEVSPTGRTRTAPAAGQAISRMSFGFVSCQNYPAGYYTPYRDVAAADLDLLVHLGDYIYEGDASGPVRPHTPAAEIMSLSDYRVRHAQYRSDPDLQLAHAAVPWFVTWDDHEVDNNYADLEADPDMSLPGFTARRAAAYQAYWEHMPLRRSRKPRAQDMDLFRRFSWGDAATFHVLDGRQHRSDQPVSGSPKTPSGYTESAVDASRSMLGADQLDWLKSGLSGNAAHWNVLANQTAFAPFDRNSDPTVRDFGGGDNWDGYVADRQRILDHLRDQGIGNAVVITGDSHSNWVRDVPPNQTDFDAPPLATEFMGTSISSGGDPARVTTTFGGDPNNPHLKLRNNQRGWVRCDLQRDLWTSTYRVVDTVTREDATASTLATFVVEQGRPGAVHT